MFYILVKSRRGWSLLECMSSSSRVQPDQIKTRQITDFYQHITEYPLQQFWKITKKYVFWLDKDHLIRVKPPVLKLLFEERSADVRWVVQLPRPVVVQDLGKYPRMPFEDVNLIWYVSKIWYTESISIFLFGYQQRVTFYRFLDFEVDKSDTCWRWL